MLQRCKLYACPSCYNPTIPLFVYSSNQERYQLKSIEEGAHFSFRVKFWMGQMTTTVIVYIKKNQYCENKNCAILPVVANCLYSAS